MTDGIALERRYRVSSADGEMGSVSVGTGEPAAAADAWVDVVTPTVTLTATPKPGYKFVGWTGGISGGDPTAAMATFTVTGARWANLKPNPSPRTVRRWHALRPKFYPPDSRECVLDRAFVV